MRILAALLLAAAAAFAAPQIDLIVHGPGDDAWSKFGHCALRVGGENGIVYSYGYANFYESGFAWRYIRREAMFQLHSRTWQQELEVYKRRDRTVTVYRLDLTDEQAEFIAKRLAQPLEYRYEHQKDNCATRIRDLIDEAKGGAVRRSEFAVTPTGTTYRTFTRRATAGTPWLAVSLELAGGPAQDRFLNGWDWMYLPEHLVRLADDSRGKVVYLRQGSADATDSRWPFWPVALVLAALIAFGSRIARWLAAAVFGLFGIIVWGLVAFSQIDDFAWNENVFLFWPTDLVLLGIRAQRYAWLRIVVVAGYALWSMFVVITHAPVQPNVGFIVAALAVCWSIALRDLLARGDVAADDV